MRSSPFGRLTCVFNVYGFQALCPNLKVLKIGWCSRVTNSSVESLVQNGIPLTELDMSLTSITDGACSSLSAFQNLESLDVSATKVTDEGIQKLFCKRLPALQRLLLRFIEDLSAATLRRVVEQAPNVSFLDVAYSGDGEDLSPARTVRNESVTEGNPTNHGGSRMRTTLPSSG